MNNLNPLNLKNKIIRITSYRGQLRNRVARVLDVRDIHKDWVNSDYASKHPLERSRYLVTIHDLERNVFRSYYHSYIGTKPMGFTQRLWFRLSQWWEEN